jgi:hypothetical protein
LINQNTHILYIANEFISNILTTKKYILIFIYFYAFHIY